MSKSKRRRQQQEKQKQTKGGGVSTAVKTGFAPAYTIEKSTIEKDPPTSGGETEDTEASYASVIEVPELSEKVGFPCFLVTGDTKYLDKDDMPLNLCYIIAGNGTFIYKKNALFPSLTKVEGLGSLADLSEYCWYQEELMPRDIVMKVVGFFKAVYDKHKSEAIVLLYHNPKTLEWQVLVPKQTVSGASANYDMVTPDQVPEGFSRVGTWHSHANMSAFFSGVDDHDDHRDDGLHLTLGDLGDRYGSMKGQFVPSIVASYASNGQRWGAKPYWVMDAPVKILEETSVKKFMSGHVSQEKTTDTEYILRLAETDDLSFPAEWMEKVSHMAIVTVKHGSGGSIVPFASGSGQSYGGTEDDSGYGSCWTYRRGSNYDAHYRTIGCSECIAYQTRTTFGALGELIDLLGNKENIELLQAFLDVKDELNLDPPVQPSDLDEEYFEQIVNLHNLVKKADERLANKLNARDILWTVAMVHDNDLYEYFNSYYDWWTMHPNQGACYCVNPSGEANELQMKYAPDEYEPMDFNDSSFEECVQFYPFGGFSWDVSTWNAKTTTYWKEALEFREDEYASYIDAEDHLCYDCVKYRNTLGGSEEQCERYVEIIELNGLQVAGELSWNDKTANECEKFVDYWSGSDLPFEFTLEELARREIDELNTLLDEGKITVDDYMSAMWLQEYDGGGC